MDRHMNGHARTEREPKPLTGSGLGPQLQMKVGTPPF